MQQNDTGTWSRSPSAAGNTPTRPTLLDPRPALRPRRETLSQAADPGYGGVGLAGSCGRPAEIRYAAAMLPAADQARPGCPP